MDRAPRQAARQPALGEKLSIVLLTFNCANRIGAILDQLMSLGVPVVAVDNGSADGTADLLASRPGLEVVRLSHNTGAAGRNAGAERVQTPYVAFCDDDGWYERDGLEMACEVFDRHPELGLINARILVGKENRLDPISAEMAASPLPDRQGLPGAVLLSFMGGAAIMRTSAYLSVGGYDPRFFIGGEEETLSFKMIKNGCQMRYLPGVIMHHRPSLANAEKLQAYGLRNTLWNTWLHRRWRSAVRWTAFILADAPKNKDWVRGLMMTIKGLPWVLRERSVMARDLDADLSVLDARRFAHRRPLLNTRGWKPADARTAREGTRAT